MKRLSDWLGKSARRPDNDNVDQKLKALVAIVAFSWQEGGVAYARKDVQAVLRDVPLNHPRVRRTFREWEESGYAQVVGKNDVYIRFFRTSPQPGQLDGLAQRRPGQALREVQEIAAFEVRLAGLWQDGVRDVPQRVVEKLLDTSDIDSAHVQRALINWEKMGLIQRVGRRDRYLRLLKPFPDDGITGKDVRPRE